MFPDRYGGKNTHETNLITVGFIKSYQTCQDRFKFIQNWKKV